MYKLNIIDKISFLLVLIGAINWGLIGLLHLNLVKLISFGYCTLETIIYVLVGAAAIDLIVLILKNNTISKKNSK